MDIYLNVKTVQTVDSGTLKPHTAYTVFRPCAEQIQVASAWTLRDAVELFARIYTVDRALLKLKRPFLSQ